MKACYFLLWLSTAAASATAAPMRSIQACTLEDGSEATLRAQYDAGLDADRFYLTMDGKTETAFTDLPDADYAGQVRLSQCLHHVLIFAISYGAPYLKGMVLRRTAEDRTTQRIDFSEKTLPELLYLSRRETKLVVPNAGHGVSGKYLVYRFRVGEGQGQEANAVDAPPATSGFKAIQARK
jgi:hypothetical protein